MAISLAIATKRYRSSLEESGLMLLNMGRALFHRKWYGRNDLRCHRPGCSYGQLRFSWLADWRNRFQGAYSSSRI